MLSFWPKFKLCTIMRVDGAATFADCCAAALSAGMATSAAVVGERSNDESFEAMLGIFPLDLILLRWKKGAKYCYDYLIWLVEYSNSITQRYAKVPAQSTLTVFMDSSM